MCLNNYGIQNCPCAFVVDCSCLNKKIFKRTETSKYREDSEGDYRHFSKFRKAKNDSLRSMPSTCPQWWIQPLKRPLPPSADRRSAANRMIFQSIHAKKNDSLRRQSSDFSFEKLYRDCMRSLEHIEPFERIELSFTTPSFILSYNSTHVTFSFEVRNKTIF